MEALGNRANTVNTDQIFAHAGLKGSLLQTNWQWELVGGIGRMDQDTNTRGYLLKNGIAAAVGPSGLDAGGNLVCGQPVGGVVPAANVIPGCVPLNIFNPNDPGQIAALSQVATNYQQNYNYNSSSGALNLNGKLFDMPPASCRRRSAWNIKSSRASLIRMS